MSEKQWEEAVTHYNNPETILDTLNYNVAHGVPYNKEIHLGASLKRHCVDFEEQIQQWKATAQGGEAISLWKQRQLSLMPPCNATYTKPTKTGKVAFVKRCCHCHVVKDGFVHGKSRHSWDNCKDGFPVWDLIPFPLPKNGWASRRDGKTVINEVICISAFRHVFEEAETVLKSGGELDVQSKNLLCFEELA
ncbi:hypothetical protein K439DRAFT_1612108 [Ramaria rubella]|nr:hypothetical protein K439DRAFT_1612108 [Ramaria rubella]